MKYERSAVLMKRSSDNLFRSPIIIEQTSYDAQRTLRVLAPLSGLLLLLILYWGFRSLQGVILPVFVASFSLPLDFGISSTSWESLTVVSATLPVILLAIVTAYGIHFVNRYYEEQSKWGDDVDRSYSAGNFIPILLSALTTMGGLYLCFPLILNPLLNLDFIPLWEFSLVFSYPFFLGAFLPFLFPSLTSLLFPGGRGFSRPDRPFLAFYGSGITHHRNLIIAIIVVALAVLTIGIPRIQ